MGSKTDWNTWHDAYADPASLQSERLRIVQQHIQRWLDATSPEPVAVVSSCAGDGRDLLELLEGRRDADRVTATLLESDASCVARANARIARAGLSEVEVRYGDAGVSSAYSGAVPADLVLLCGVFENIKEGDIRRTIAALPQLCSAEALVIWSMHRQAPDLTPQIREWFADRGFDEDAFVTPEHGRFSVGVHRFLGDPAPLVEAQHLFSFFQ